MGTVSFSKVDIIHLGASCVAPKIAWIDVRFKIEGVLTANPVQNQKGTCNHVDEGVAVSNLLCFLIRSPAL